MTSSSSDGDYLKQTENLAHPVWDVVDPTLDIHALFPIFDEKFFRGKLSPCELEWSKTMHTHTGRCYRRMTMDRFGRRSCTIGLSESLLKSQPRKHAVEALLHAMIHAYCFVRGGELTTMHDARFMRVMNRINQKAGTNVTACHLIDKIQWSTSRRPVSALNDDRLISNSGKLPSTSASTGSVEHPRPIDAQDQKQKKTGEEKQTSESSVDSLISNSTIGKPPPTLATTGPVKEPRLVIYRAPFASVAVGPVNQPRPVIVQEPKRKVSNGEKQKSISPADDLISKSVIHKPPSSLTTVGQKDQPRPVISQDPKRRKTDEEHNKRKSPVDAANDSRISNSIIHKPPSSSATTCQVDQPRPVISLEPKQRKKNDEVPKGKSPVEAAIDSLNWNPVIHKQPSTSAAASQVKQPRPIVAQKPERRKTGEENKKGLSPAEAAMNSLVSNLGLHKPPSTLAITGPVDHPRSLVVQETKRKSPVEAANDGLASNPVIHKLPSTSAATGRGQVDQSRPAIFQEPKQRKTGDEATKGKSPVEVASVIQKPPSTSAATGQVKQPRPIVAQEPKRKNTGGENKKRKSPADTAKDSLNSNPVIHKQSSTLAITGSVEQPRPIVAQQPKQKKTNGEKPKSKSPVDAANDNLVLNLAIHKSKSSSAVAGQVKQSRPDVGQESKRRKTLVQDEKGKSPVEASNASLTSNFTVMPKPPSTSAATGPVDQPRPIGAQEPKQRNTNEEKQKSKSPVEATNDNLISNSVICPSTSTAAGQVKLPRPIVVHKPKRENKGTGPVEAANDNLISNSNSLDRCSSPEVQLIAPIETVIDLTGDDDDEIVEEPVDLRIGSVVLRVGTVDLHVEPIDLRILPIDLSSTH